MKNRLILFKLKNKKIFFETGGLYNLIFASFRSRYFFYNIWGLFHKRKNTPPSKGLMTISLVKITKIVILGVFFRER